ncbi:hypothetical protein TWF281_003374 [Arthrobotrys megalospora]
MYIVVLVKETMVQEVYGNYATAGGRQRWLTERKEWEAGDSRQEEVVTVNASKFWMKSEREKPW